MVSFELIDDLVLLVHHLAAVSPHHPMAPRVGVADRIAQGKAARCALGLELLEQLEKVGQIGGDLLEPGGLHLAAPVGDASAQEAHAQSDPAPIARAVAPHDVVPAAVLAAQVVGQLGQIEQLVGVLVRIVVPAQHDVRPTADVGGHRRLGAYVLEVLAVHAHAHAGPFGEGTCIGHPLLFVSLDEALPAQHAQLRTLLRRVLEIRCRGRGIDQRAAASREARRAQHLERVAPRKICHGQLPSEVAPCRRTAREAAAIGVVVL